MTGRELATTLQAFIEALASTTLPMTKKHSREPQQDALLENLPQGAIIGFTLASVPDEMVT